MAIYVTISNANGFIVAGILKGSFLPTYKLPSAANIKAGVMTTGISLIKVRSVYSPLGVNTTLMISGLEANTSYALIYAPTVDDPTYEAVAGQVVAINFTTSTLNTIKIWSWYLGWATILLIITLFE